MLALDFKSVRCIALLLVCIVCATCEEDILVINPFEATGTTVSYTETHQNKSLHVAVVSMHCDSNKAQNLNDIARFVEQIMTAHPQTECIAFGETILNWYYYKPNYIENKAETIPGGATRFFSNLCKKHKIYISTGICEKHIDTLFNSLLVFDTLGQIVAKHRKVALTSEDLRSGYHSGNQTTILNINGFKTGLMVCADVNSKNITLEYINQQVELIIGAFASPISEPRFNIISRRMNAWQVFANRVGTEHNSNYSGLIYISDPAGNLKAKSSDKETYITYTIKK